MFELTNQSRLGIQEAGFKETGAKTVFPTEGKYITGKYEKTETFSFSNPEYNDQPENEDMTCLLYLLTPAQRQKCLHIYQNRLF